MSIMKGGKCMLNLDHLNMATNISTAHENSRNQHPYMNFTALNNNLSTTLLIITMILSTITQQFSAISQLLIEYSNTAISQALTNQQKC